MTVTAQLKSADIDIIVVDDDEDDRLLLNYALKQLKPNATVLCVPDAHDALTYMETCQRQPSLLITDLNMPCVNGLELLNDIRQSVAYRSLPVVVLTTSQADEDRKRCYQAGANAFLVKPIHLSDMTELLRLCVRVWLS